MSAEFWTKILTEIKTGKGKGMAEYRKQARSKEFNQETLYHNDILDGVYTWLQKYSVGIQPDQQMALKDVLDDYIEKYLDIMYQYGTGADRMNATKTKNSVVFTFQPTASPYHGGVSAGNKKVYDSYNKERKKQLGVLGNKILRAGKVGPAFGGFVFIEKVRGQVYSSSNSLDKASGVSDNLHGDMKLGVKTTVAAYAGRSTVAEKSKERKKARKKINPMTLVDHMPLYKGIEEEFDTTLLDWIDTEYGFKILQDNPIDGSKLKDEYVLVQSARGTAKENARMRGIGADSDKIFDEMIEYGVKKLREDMLKKYNEPRFAEGIEASTPLKERGKRAVTKQTISRIKKATKGSKNIKVSSKEKKPTKGKKYNTKKVLSKGKRKVRGQKRRPKTPKIGIILAKQATGKSRKTVSRNGKGSSPIALMALINKVLPRELMKNMTGVYPRSLENRTGRFAGSAQVTHVIPFPNSVEVQYTYQKNPYEVFEQGSGNPLASRGRDPRTIIGGTIREIAQEMMGTKFGLVRTKRT